MTNKSINASESTETAIMAMFPTADRVSCSRYFDWNYSNPYYQLNNGYDSSVNPQDSIETAVLKWK
ncbi:MAG TPA: hypothetical protein ENH57_02105 [Actinobacteria bacterium]|nr:hypothetical protein [Actinomycetota bacterium]